jgi:hypothetical protein
VTLNISSGVVFGTVQLQFGNQSDIELLQAVQNQRPEQDPKPAGVSLLGPADLLIYIEGVFDFRSETNLLRAHGHMPNWHLAVALNTSASSASRNFRTIGFFRFERPAYESVTTSDLSALLSTIERTSAEYGISSRVLLGFGWADLYIDMRGDELAAIYRCMAACRALTLPNGGRVFRNAFSVIGFEVPATEHLETSRQLVRPSIALRIAPDQLSTVIQRIRKLTELFGWHVDVSPGKRDLSLRPAESIELARFLRAHRAVRSLNVSPEEPVRKIETRIYFSPDELGIDAAIVPTIGDQAFIGCQCLEDGKKASDRFLSVIDNWHVMHQGLAQSFTGLAHLYREALQDRDSCCDYDQAAAHFFSQAEFLERYRELSNRVAASSDLTVRREWQQMRESVGLLDILSIAMFNQEQNGSYADLLSRSERMPLFSGGMQKLNSVLYSAIAPIVKACRLSTSPVLCWWPVGHVQVVRPLSIIKVPIFYVYEPEVALFLMIHEVGQLFALQNDASVDLSDPVTKARYEDFLRLFGRAIKGNTQRLEEEGQLPRSTPRAQDTYHSRSTDAGLLLTDLYADFVMLRVTLQHDLNRFIQFALRQYLVSEYSTSASKVSVRTYAFMVLARTYAAAFACRLARRPDLNSIAQLPYDATAASAGVYFHLVMEMPDLQPILDDRPAAKTDLLDPQLHADVCALLRTPLLQDRMDFSFNKTKDLPSLSNFSAPPQGSTELAKGRMTQLDADRLAEYCDALLHLPRVTETQRRTLFRARSAFVMSALASARPPRKLRALVESLPEPTGTVLPTTP